MTATTEAGTASPEPASRRDRFVDWIRSHRLLSAGIAAATAIVIVGATIGGVTINAQIRHDQAVAAAETALEDLRAAEQQLESSTDALTAATADAIAYRDAVRGVAAGNDAYLGSTADRLLSEVEELTELIAATATEASTADDVTLLISYDAPDVVDVVDTTATTEDLDVLSRELRESTSDLDDLVLDVDSSTSDLEVAGAEIAELLAEISTGIPELAQQLTAANPSATQEAKDAFSGAVAALDGVKFVTLDDVALLAGYVDAAKAVEAAHAAEEARKAQEAAGPGGSPGAGGSNPGTGGSPGTGGGNPGTGGGTPGGGTVDNNRYVQTNGYYVPFGSCTWATPHSTHDPGPGGTSTPGFTVPWSYQNMGTYIQFYVC
jgi:hypothetical protein